MELIYPTLWSFTTIRSIENALLTGTGQCFFLWNHQCSWGRLQHLRSPSTSGILITLVLLLIGTMLITPSIPHTVTASSVNWSNLRGAVYRWQQLTPAADQANSANPATEMAIFKSLGFNYARIDDIDWKAIQSNQSGEMALLTQVANACDANGIYCVYIGGVTSTLNRIPSNIGGGAYGYTSQGFTNFLTDFFQNKNIAISGIPVTMDGQSGKHCFSKNGSLSYRPSTRTLPLLDTSWITSLTTAWEASRIFTIITNT